MGAVVASSFLVEKPKRLVVRGGGSSWAQTVEQLPCLQAPLPQLLDEGGSDASRGFWWGANNRAGAMGPLVPKKAGLGHSAPYRCRVHAAGPVNTCRECLSEGERELKLVVAAADFCPENIVNYSIVGSLRPAGRIMPHSECGLRVTTFPLVSLSNSLSPPLFCFGQATQHVGS